MSETIRIASHKGPYTVFFDDKGLGRLGAAVPDKSHFVVDRRVAELYPGPIGPLIASGRTLLVDATEENKSLHRFPAYVQALVDQQVRRDHWLVAVGGGITQDITCFLAATLLRGMSWRFFPTTLLAQADSCIGSKSSINVGTTKNILGTFTPPQEVVIDTGVLATLSPADQRSGVGEMLKAHAIDGPAAFDAIAADYGRLFIDRQVMGRYIRGALAIKKRFIEQDEFDRGVRNVFNYGHSFGHAIESATDFAVPHGIAVTMGMDMANFVAAGLGVGREVHFQRMHPVLAANFKGYADTPVPLSRLLDALARDKKNTGSQLTLILPDADGNVHRRTCANDRVLAGLCARYLDEVRAS